MKVKILSDSTCDLSARLITENDIGIIPLTVLNETAEYKDGITITPADIFAHVDAGGALFSTSAVSVGEYTEHFAKYASEYDAVIHINIGSGFSSCNQNARLAASEFNNVYVIDSMNLSTGQGLVVLKACELAASGDSIDRICDELTDFTKRVEASFLLDRLEYMVKGGRCSSAAALGANLLNLKPCIEVRDGKMTVVKKYRGNMVKCLSAYVKDRLDNTARLDNGTIFITHTTISSQCLDTVDQAIRSYNFFKHIYETDAGCTISCHCGPGTLGILFVRQ